MSGELRAMIEDFCELFYAQRQPRAAFEKHVSADYLQHSPALTDGPEAALRMLEPLFGREEARFEVKRILIDDPYAVVHLHGRPDPALPGVAVADFYRVENGKIVEHWDVIQPVPENRTNPRDMIA